MVESLSRTKSRIKKHEIRRTAVRCCNVLSAFNKIRLNYRAGHLFPQFFDISLIFTSVKLDNINPETGEGEIVAKGDNVMLGYYKDPERTRQVLSDDGWFRTNDLACMDENGRFYIKGRLNNMILGPSGENIYPEEIEQVINNFGGVNESLVMERDGKLVALVKFDDNVLNWNQETEDKFFENLQAKKKAVLDYVNKHVGKSSKVNSGEVVKEDFEKTATHKIRRFKYQDAYGDEPQQPEKNEKE